MRSRTVRDRVTNCTFHCILSLITWRTFLEKVTHSGNLVINHSVWLWIFMDLVITHSWDMATLVRVPPYVSWQLCSLFCACQPSSCLSGRLQKTPSKKHTFPSLRAKIKVICKCGAGQAHAAVAEEMGSHGQPCQWSGRSERKTARLHQPPQHQQFPCSLDKVCSTERIFYV